MGSNKRCDVTQNYKFEEGSELERAALGLDRPSGDSDVTFDVSFSRQPAIGEDFDVIVTVSYFWHYPKNTFLFTLSNCPAYTNTSLSVCIYLRISLS